MAVLNNASFAPNQTVASDVGYVKPLEGWYACTVKDAKDVADDQGNLTKFTVTFVIDAASYAGEGGRELRHTFPYPSPVVNADGRTGMEQDLTLKFLQMILKPGSDEKATPTFLQEFNSGAYASVDPIVQAVGKTVHINFKPDGRQYVVKTGPKTGQNATADIFRLVFGPNFAKHKEEWRKEREELARINAMKNAGTAAAAAQATTQTTTQTTGAGPTSFPGLTPGMNGMPGMGAAASPFPPTA